MKAEDARKMSIESGPVVVEELKRSLFVSVRGAASEGKTGVTFSVASSLPNSLKEQFLREVTSAGYTVTPSHHGAVEETLLRINW